MQFLLPPQTQFFPQSAQISIYTHAIERTQSLLGQWVCLIDVILPHEFTGALDYSAAPCRFSSGLLKPSEGLNVKDNLNGYTSKIAPYSLCSTLLLTLWALVKSSALIMLNSCIFSVVTQPG